MIKKLLLIILVASTKLYAENQQGRIVYDATDLTPRQINQRLKNLAKEQNINESQAILNEQNQIVILYQQAQVISKISIEASTRTIEANLTTTLRPFRKAVYSEQLLTQIESALREKLKTSGFFNPTIRFNMNAQNELTVDVYEGYPCRLSQIQVDFRIPSNIKLDLEVGSICHDKIIRSQISEFEEDLADEGYNEARIAQPQFIYNVETNTAILKLTGIVGQRILSEVKSPLKRPPFVSFIIGDDLHTIDNDVTDPDTMRTEITRKFRNSGYHDIKITGQQKKTVNESTVKYRFQVEPGPRYTIEDVQIEGLTAFSKEKALEVMDLYSILDTTPLLSDTLIEAAIENLKGYFGTQGFWNAKIYYPKVIKNPQRKTAKLIFTVKQGQRRLFSDAIFFGNERFVDEDLRSRLGLAKDDVVTWEQIVNFQRDLQNVYREQGYLYTKVKIDLVQSKNTADINTIIKVTIEEGPRVKFGKIYINGLEKTKEYVVRRELKMVENSWYSPEAIENTREALIDLGLFSFVTITAQESSDFSKKTTTIPYTINLRESRPGQVSFGPGFSRQDGGRFSLDASYNNLGGTGRQVFFTGAFSEEITQEDIDRNSILGFKLGVGYIEPYLLDWPVDGVLSYNKYAEAIDQQSEISTSVQATLRKRIIRQSVDIDLSFYTLYRVTRESATASIRRLLLSDEIQIREVGTKGIYDSRDNISWPTAGFIALADLSVAGLVFGADTRYLHWSTTYNHFLSLSDTFVFASSFTLESFSNVLRTETNFDLLPSSLRIRSGGAESNRGFLRNELGPIVRYTDSDGEIETSNIGGTQALNLKLELRQKLSSSLALSYFIDSSNSYLTEEEVALFTAQFADVETPAVLLDNFSYEFTELLSDPSLLWRANYLSYGLALNYITPVGSISVSYGYPLSRCPLAKTCTEKRGNQQFRKIFGGQLQFNVGTYF